MSAMQLVSTNVPGNLHQTCTDVNRMGLAQYVVAMDAAPSYKNTIVVFKVPAEKAATIRRLLDYPPEAWDNPPPYELFAGIGEKR